jgi:hypothetical protein
MVGPLLIKPRSKLRRVILLPAGLLHDPWFLFVKKPTEDFHSSSRGVVRCAPNSKLLVTL